MTTASDRVPVISVVMSVHNDARYLRGGLRSVLDQQDVDIEFIVIDDGSTDETRKILSDHAANDSRLRVVEQENAGLTRALIRGCAMARGRYIARQDADDLSVPGRLKMQVALLDADPELSFVSCWAEVIGPEDEPLLLHTRPSDSETATRLLMHGRSGPPGHGSVMMRRSAYERVGGYREKFYFAQDGDLWLRLGAIGRVNYVPQVLYRYRLSADSISGRLHAHKLAYAQLIDKLHEARQRGEDDAKLLASAQLPVLGAAPTERPSSDSTNYFIGRCLVARRDPRARRYLRRSLRGNPFKLRTWLMWLSAELSGPFWAPRTSTYP